MKKAALFCLLLMLTASLHPKETQPTKISGPYLGQKPPGLTPEIFAPGIVSTGLDELNSIFSPDGSEFYFCVRNIAGGASIFEMKMKAGSWREPRLLPFASRFGDIDVSISPAGDALLFSSLRPRPGSTEPRKDNDFWMAVREGRKWGDPIHLGPGINSDSHDYYPVMTRNGTIYFSSQREGPRTNNIYMAEKVNGAYAGAVKLGDAVNSEFRDFDPFISPDGDMLIFASDRPGGQGMSDLHISFRGPDGAWTPAVNMGERINSPGPEFCPMLSPDGKVLLFTSSRFARGRFPESPLRFSDFLAAHNAPENGVCDIYWVDAGFIEALRPHEAATARNGAGGNPRRRMALATYATDPEQARAVRALARSIRERGGEYADSPIYVVTTDAGLFPAVMGKHPALEILPLEMERSFLDYPLALKAFAAAQIEKRARDSIDTLTWLDPGVIVLGPLQDLELGHEHDAAVRPVTLANTIALPPQTAPNDYWEPIYKATGLTAANLPSYETIVDPLPIQPYFNCEVFSFNPKLGIAAEWARLLAGFLKNGDYQKSVCTTFPRRLFLHQAVLSAVISSRIKPDRIRALPLTSAYPFSQHDRLPAAKKISSLDELSLLIFDRTWQQDRQWLERIPATEPLREWFMAVYREYLGD